MAQYEEKLMVHQLKQLTQKERTHRLCKKGYTGRNADKEGSADVQRCDEYSETGIFPKWHKASCCGKREKSGC